MNRSLLLAFPGVLLLLCTACSKSAKDEVSVPPDPVVPPVVTTDTTPQAKYDITQLGECILFAAKPEVDTMKRQDYNELSGIAASHTNNGVLYVHQDASGTNDVLITNALGVDLGRIVLDNISTRNLEDIKVGPGPDPAKSYIYLADIGDNKASRTTISVYRFPEPLLADLSATAVTHVSVVDKIELKYPVSALNAETLLIDPVTKDLYIPSKETSKSTFYTAPYPQSVTGVTTLKAVVKTNFDLLTSGDISPDGTEIILRSRSQVWYWKRVAGQTMAQTILSQPQTASYSGNEHQGEGICFAANAGGYFTNTEIRDYPGSVSTISFYKRK